MEPGHDQRSRENEAGDGLSAVHRFREVWWIRHGESLGNAGARTADSAGYSLTGRGASQAAALAGWLPREPGLIVTSNYRRSRETAAPVAARYADSPVEEWPAHEISFLAAEKCRDTTQIERRGLAEAFWERWDPAFIDGPGAESFSGFMDRVAASLERARCSAAAFTVVFTHAQFMRGLLWQNLRPHAAIDREAMQMFHQFSHGIVVPNCSVLPMLIDADRRAFCGTILSPIAGSEDAATLEQIKLSGL